MKTTTAAGSQISLARLGFINPLAHRSSLYCPLGELFGRVIRCGKLEECDARRYLAEVISGVEYLHGQVPCTCSTCAFAFTFMDALHSIRAARHDLAIRSAYPPIPFSLPIRAPTHPPRVSRTAISSWRTCCSPRTTAASYATLAWRTPTRAGPMERCRPSAPRSRCCAARRAMLHQRSSRASGPTLSLSLSLTLTLTLTPTLAPTRTLTLTTDPDH